MWPCTNQLGPEMLHALVSTTHRSTVLIGCNAGVRMCACAVHVRLSISLTFHELCPTMVQQPPYPGVQHVWL